MDGTWPRDYEQAIIRAMQNTVNGLTCLVGKPCRLIGKRVLAEDTDRRDQFFYLKYA
jgi:hypothetical protein